LQEVACLSGFTQHANSAGCGLSKPNAESLILAIMPLGTDGGRRYQPRGWSNNFKVWAGERGHSFAGLAQF
jgi:hypothetical protein